jgi:hypothetical protein
LKNASVKNRNALLKAAEKLYGLEENKAKNK